MAKRKTASSSAFDAGKVANVHQVGGIRTATFDHPDAGGRPACHVAMFDTGAGLRFTVALDRGGDLVEASFADTNLAFVSPRGYAPPSHAYHREDDWLANWPGGLVTTCGPQYIGHTRTEDGRATNLHGHHSNTPAAVTAIHNPDLRRGDATMHLDLVIRDVRVLNHLVEVRRRISCTLGEPVIEIHDEVTNLSEGRVPHNWLYHVNLGYPLLDAGAKLIYAGKRGWLLPDPGKGPTTAAKLARLKRIPEPPKKIHDLCVMIEQPKADRSGRVRFGLVNTKRRLGFELSYPKSQLPRFTNWQHFGPGGLYATGIEPYFGSLVGKDRDSHGDAAQWLAPGQSRRYDLTLRVHADRPALQDLAAQDGEVTPIKNEAVSP